MGKMRKLLSIGIVVLLFTFMIGYVQARDSPEVLIVPDTISRDGYVDIYVTARTDNTTLASFDPIKVQRRVIIRGLYPGPVLEDYYLQLDPGAPCMWGPIILPDVGDQVRIRFPYAAVEVTVDEDGDVDIGTSPVPWWWIAAEDPRWGSHYPFGWDPRAGALIPDTYYVLISGFEDGNMYQTVSSFVVRPHA